MLIDSHCHLTHPRLASEEQEVVARAGAAGIAGMITIGTGVADARRCLAVARRNPGVVFCSAGIDPFSSHSAGDGYAAEIDALTQELAGGGFCAVGEIGLDYHYDLDPRPIQAERFEEQLEIARALDLPVIVHVREAHEDLLAILTSHPECRGVIHSFTGGPAEARCYLDLGWHLGFNGIVTFPSGEPIREAARITPVDRVLLETDSPYLAPVPFRGRRCEPALLVHTAAAVAQCRGASPEQLAIEATRNTRLLFAI